jgi:hypothetical protein
MHPDVKSGHRPLAAGRQPTAHSGHVDETAAGRCGEQEFTMKMVASMALAAALLAGCISSSSPPAPEKNTTVVVPQHSGTTVICQDGTQPPCR